MKTAIAILSIAIFIACNKNDTQRPTISEFIHCTIDSTIVNWDMNPDTIYSQNPPPPTLQQVLDNYYITGYAYYTNAFGKRPSNNFPQIIFALQYNNAIGTYPLGNVYFLPSANIIGFRVAQNSVVNITALGNAGTGFIEGNFTTQIKIPPSTIAKTLTCNFKIPRPL
jgi:hypothetical protein